MKSVAAVSNLRWPYGMALVGRGIGEGGDDEPDDVVRAVHQAVVAVGHHRHAAREHADGDLAPADHEVQEEGDPEDAPHSGLGHVGVHGARGRHHFIRAPLSSVAKIQPTTLPGWMSSSAPQNWRSRRNREEVSARGDRSRSRPRCARSGPSSAPCSPRAGPPSPRRAQASSRSGVTSRASSSRVTGGILHSGPRSSRPSGSRMGMPMETMSRRTRRVRDHAAPTRRAHLGGGRSRARGPWSRRRAAAGRASWSSLRQARAGPGSRRPRCGRRARFSRLAQLLEGPVAHEAGAVGRAHDRVVEGVDDVVAGVAAQQLAGHARRRSPPGSRTPSARRW